MLCIHCKTEVESLSGTCPHCGKDLADSSSPTARIGSPGKGPIFDFNPGQTFSGRYTIVEEVGSGGMAQVYKAMDQELGRTVALKLITTSTVDKELIERFRRELSLAREVTHPNVCRVFDLGESEGIRFISMEYVDGQNLRDWIQAVGRLSPHQTVGVAKQICKGLEAIHDQSIVHRDLKPGNIMLDRCGRAVVMDFGLAYHPEAEQITAKGEALGTVAYLSPEQARGRPVDGRSDIYTLGLVLFEMLTGQRPPADGNSLPLALREKGQRCSPPSHLIPEVPESLDGVVLRCMERKPEKRFQSVREVEQALDEFRDDVPVVPSRGGDERRKRVSWRWPLFGLAAVVAAALIMLYVLTPSAPPALSGVRSAAVLPLAYDGPDESAYLRDLLPLILIRNLQGVPELDVAPYATSRSFDPGEDAGSVAGQIGVESLVVGEISVRDAVFDGVLRIYRSEAGGEAVWSEPISGETGAALDVADRLSDEIAAVLGRESTRGTAASLDGEAFEHYLEGKTLLEGWDVEENYARSAESFSRALEQSPDFAEARAGLARALWKQYDEKRQPELVEKALEEALRVVSLAPRLPEAHLALGEVQLGRGRSAEAAASFEEALRLAPADDRVCRQIADAYAALGRSSEAETMYQRAIELRPGYWENYNYKGVYYLLQVGELEKSKKLFQEVIRLRPESDTGYTNLAVAHILGGQFKEAEPLLQAALRIHPSADAHNNLGFVYYSSGRYEDAVREFASAVRTGDKDITYYGNLGDAHRQLGRRDEAHGAYAAAIELGREHLKVNPADAEDRALLAMSLAGAERCVEAREEAARAIGDLPDNPTLRYYVAVAYAVCGDRETAILNTLRAIEGGVEADVRTNPDLKPLLGDPRVQKVLQ